MLHAKGTEQRKLPTVLAFLGVTNTDTASPVHHSSTGHWELIYAFP